MQAYFEPEQAFSLSMPRPVFEISIGYKKKHVKTLLNNTFKSNTNLLSVYDNIMKEQANLNSIEPVIDYQLKILFQAYNFIIKSITRSLIILRNRER